MKRAMPKKKSKIRIFKTPRNVFADLGLGFANGREKHTKGLAGRLRFFASGTNLDRDCICAKCGYTPATGKA
jgi:hypothetical protein